MVNAFGHNIPEMKVILADREVEATITSMLGDVLKNLGIPESNAARVISETLRHARDYRSITDYEREVHAVLDREGLTTAFPQKLFERTELMYEQLKPHLLPGSVLDLGCGDGNVGRLAANEGYDVTLADVFTHPNIEQTGLPFKLFKQGERTPFADDQFDNTLSLYVYHHSDDPIGSLLEAKRVTRPGGRIIVMESVYGIGGIQLPLEEYKKARVFTRLPTSEQQRMSNIFFDHFWNRVLMYSDDPDKKINVPFNFNTPRGWSNIFYRNRLVKEEVIHLGIDQPTVPEYHTLHVLRVR